MLGVRGARKNPKTRRPHHLSYPVIEIGSQQQQEGRHSMASILVTGTSKGIGMATALVLGRAGHTVYATMRNPSGAPELA
jgi:hypothetical protein